MIACQLIFSLLTGFVLPVIYNLFVAIFSGHWYSVSLSSYIICILFLALAPFSYYTFLIRPCFFFLDGKRPRWKAYLPDFFGLIQHNLHVGSFITLTIVVTLFSFGTQTFGFMITWICDHWIIPFFILDRKITMLEAKKIARRYSNKTDRFIGIQYICLFLISGTLITGLGIIMFRGLHSAVFGILTTEMYCSIAIMACLFPISLILIKRLFLYRILSSVIFDDMTAPDDIDNWEYVPQDTSCTTEK